MVKHVAIVLSNSSGKEYDVYLNQHEDTDFLACSCPQWAYRLGKYRAKCKHIEAVLEVWDMDFLRSLPNGHPVYVEMPITEEG